MRRIFRLVVLLVFVSSGWVLAEEKQEQKFTEWHLRDLHYYDESGVIKKLEVAPKLVIRFVSTMNAEEKSVFLARFSPVGQGEYPDDPTRIFVEFSGDTSAARLLEIANEMARSGLAEAAPVFVVENLEAIVEGVTVETKIVLGAERILERVKRHGDFSVRQTRSENGKWTFLVDEVKPPLNILVLTNLFHQDSWVKRAYPHFKFLHEPVTAAISVEPVSGTVAEVRTVTFTVKIFDPAIELSADLLPQFGEGLFAPLQNGKQPPGYLFERLGESGKREFRDRRGRIYVFSWKFKHHALGEWNIQAQPVSFTKNGVTQEVKSSGFTFVVNSQIGALNITDMPQPRPLIHSAEALTAIPQAELPQIPAYWFDKLPKPEFWVQYSHHGSVFFGVISLVMFFVVVLSVHIGKRMEKVTRRQRILKIDQTLEQARRERSYEKYNEALSSILTFLFPHLSSHPTWEEVKDDEGIRQTLEANKLEDLEHIFEELNRRHMRNFAVEPEALSDLGKFVGVFFETVRKRLLHGKEVR